VANNSITAFEFDYLSQTQSSQRCHKIEAKTFKYLEDVCVREAGHNNKVLRLGSYNGERVVQLMHHVGVIQVPNGQQVEVLPKIAKRGLGDEGEKLEARKALLNMVKTLEEYKHIESSDALLRKATMPLFEVFIEQFLISVNSLVKRGIKSSYVNQEGNLNYLKGRLNIAKQLRFNSINKHKFYVEYDDFLTDIPENRLLCSSLKKVLTYSKSNKNQKLCRELLFTFNDVPPSSNYKADIGKVIRSRGTNHYDTPLNWARLILDGLTPLSMSGNASAISLLFPMHELFESYVGAVLRNQVASSYTLHEQSKSKYLVNHNGKNWFTLKPDFLIKHDSKPCIVMDTKWKLIDKKKANGTDKYGLSQSDFYQMFAYGQKYLNGTGHMILIYPKSKTFDTPIPYSFDFSDNLKLWILPFDTSTDVEDSNRLDFIDVLEGVLEKTSVKTEV
jgi:5-methylcytosine-specific restriction enzyme subunit McrC